MLLGMMTSPWIYGVILLICVIDGFFPPMPSELVVASAAAVAWTTGTPLLVLVIATAALGAWLGDTIAFLIGRRVGLSRFRWMRRPAIARLSARAGRGLATRPTSILLAGRFIPVGRVVVNMAAGATRLPYRRFLPISVLGALLWTTVSVLMAIVAGAFLHASPIMAAVAAAVLAASIGWVVDRILSSRRAAADRRLYP
ncbi:MAG TPA: VTT domain-containing protein [Lacisediminihabitans sp.]|uniref:DedA family protein n=1 Tax=Lacisediminihabitans sp. TaxID=2787631 RepID=UPI002EDABF76